MSLSYQNIKLNHSRAEWVHRRVIVLFLVVVTGVMILTLMTGCGTPKVGLQPLFPKFEIGTFALHGDFVNVHSLQPTLSWEAFVPPTNTSSKPGREVMFTDISYELRIWQTESGSGGSLVYGKTGLKDPKHTLEKKLEANTKYIWSVRAHFLKNGQPRLTEWGMAGYLLRGFTSPNEANFRFISPEA